MREVPQLLGGVLDLGAELLQQAGQLGILSGQLSGQEQPDGQRGEVLLGTVVQVALDAAALGAGGGHDARPRGLQLVRLAAEPQAAAGRPGQHRGSLR